MMQQETAQQQARVNNHNRPDGKKWPSLYVGNLPEKSFFDLDIKKFFENAGFKIKAATVASNATKSGTLGYGYVSFHDETELERCLTTMNNATCQDKQIVLNRQGELVRNPQANIIIRNIPKQVSQQEIYKAFI